MKQAKTLLDYSFEEKQKAINKNFLRGWEPFDKLNKQVQRCILSHFMKKSYQWQPTHDKASIKPFKPVTFSQIDNALGLAYTSTSDYAALWVCNGGYLWANNTHSFIGFAINTNGEVIGIADDKDENSIYIKMS